MPTPGSLRVKRAVAGLRETMPTVAKIVDEHRKAAAKLPAADGPYGEPYAAEKARELREESKFKVKVEQGMQDVHVQNLRDGLEEARREVLSPGDSLEQQILAEMQLSRAWQRHLPALQQRADDPGGLVAYVEEHLDDTAFLRALSEEFQPWAANTPAAGVQVRDGQGLDAATVPLADLIARTVNDRILDAHPDAAELRAAESTMGRGVAAHVNSFDWASKVLDGDPHAPAQLLGWPGDDNQPVPVPYAADQPAEP